MSPSRETRARYVMIGGFLGAGKTTAVARLARRLSDQGLRVGLISNDQSSGLVDTALLRSKGFPVEEIPGGCFCCRFNSLLEAADNLDRTTRPDVFIAEPVGSCTDLIATVSYPLRRIYGDRFEVAPMSVMVDPVRAARILGLEPGPQFSEKVVYVYRKQLEEANLIVVNKCDAIEEPLRARLAAALEKAFPRARVLCCSAKAGTGLDEWFDAIDRTLPDNGPAMELDYDLYAEGEALLGWLNCTVRLESKAPFDANQTLVRLARDMRDRIAAKGQEIAHLKMTLDAEDGTGSLSVVSLVRSDGEPDLRESLLDKVDGGALIVNLRAEADPEFLKTVVDESIAALGAGLRATMEHLDRFRPARPQPLHRMGGGAP
ncbi:MAG: cobalamin biosynthesis protein P47K [Planctomycetes bacterium]|nr:cobalamin biosynthesis protein P47K [Planctomycetota bacterium]